MQRSQTWKSPAASQQRALIGFAFAVAGYMVTAYVLWWLVGLDRLSVTDMPVWDRVGDQVRAGISPYYAVPAGGGFYYAPPWALLLGLVTWLPAPVVAGGIIVAEVAALRYIAGSWIRVGWLCWLPLVGMELVQVQLNLIMAAAVLAAIRGRPELAVLGGLAKEGPILAIAPRQWRRAFVTLGAVAAVTLPFAGLWADWARQMVGSLGNDIAPGAMIAIPLLPRLVVAGLLVLTGKPWARIIAATIATPALYKITLVGLFPLLRDHQPVLDLARDVDRPRRTRRLGKADLVGSIGGSR